MRQKRKEKPAVDYGTYPVHIRNWNVHYSIRLEGDSRFGERPYWEHYCLELRGELLGPEKVKGREIRITFLAERTIDQEIVNPDSPAFKPKASGRLSSRGKRSDFIGSLPMDALSSVLSLLQFGNINYVVFQGKALRYGSASIERVSFSKEYDPEYY
jgi:hypothetical protein